ncbi:hypothetical protein AKO1_001010, partial [Acrasis kona]
FDNTEWDKKVNSLYFRNHYPETVGGALIENDNKTSYCCQCSWTSVAELSRVNNGISHQWICGGH